MLGTLAAAEPAVKLRQTGVNGVLSTAVDNGVDSMCTPGELVQNKGRQPRLFMRDSLVDNLVRHWSAVLSPT